MIILKRFLALTKKEKLELLRDQRSLLATFAYALVGPLLLFVIINGFISDATEQTKVTIGIQESPEHAQAVMEITRYLTKENVATLRHSGELPESFNQSVSTQQQPPQSPNFDVLLKIIQPQNAITRDTYTVEIYGDKSTHSSSKKLAMAVHLMNDFVAQQAQNALLKQGIVPYNDSWTLRTHVVNKQTVTTNKLMDSLLIFLLLAPFFITLNYINDSTAGERERGSLMPLLTQPVNRSLLVLAKWSVGSVLGIIGSIVTMVIGFKLIADLPIHEIGLQLDASIQNMALTAAVIAPMALMVTSLQMWIAMTAKSFKEGQSYLTLFSFIPMIAVFMAAKFEGQTWSTMLPLIGQQQMLQDIFTLHSFNLQQYLGLSFACLSVATLALLGVKQQFNAESILQGR